MTMLLVMAIAFWLQKAGPDLAAAVRGNTPPSHEWRMEKLRTRTPEQAPSEKAVKVASRGPMRSTVSSGWERALERANHRAELAHQRKLDLIDAKAPKRSQDWLDRKLDKAARREQRREEFLDKAGVFTTKAKQRIQEARDERRAWKENARRPELTDPEPESDTPIPGDRAASEPEPLPAPGTENTAQQETGQDAVVLPFKRAADEDSAPATDTRPTETGGADQPTEHRPSSEQPRESTAGTDDMEAPVTDSPLHPPPDQVREHRDGEEETGVKRSQDPRIAEVLDADLDEHVRRERLAELAGIPQPANGDDPADHDYHLPLDELQRRAETALAASKTEASVEQPAAPQPPTPQPTTTGVTMSKSGAVGEITNLGQAKAYASQMTSYLGLVQAKIDADVADMRTMAADLKGEMATAELAKSTLLTLEMTGDHLDALSAAAEQLAIIQATMAQMSEQMAPLLDAAASSSQAFRKADAVFNGQSGLAEQVQAVNASGARAANNTEFYANA